MFIKVPCNNYNILSMTHKFSFPLKLQSIEAYWLNFYGLKPELLIFSSFMYRLIHGYQCNSWKKSTTSVARSWLISTIALSHGLTDLHHALIIGGSKGGRQGRAPPPGGPNSFIFMQFLAKIWKIIAILGVGAPPWGKSWIRHCLCNQFNNKVNEGFVRCRVYE